MNFPGIRAAFTTKVSGSVARKKTAVAALFGISPEKVYIPEQKHTDRIHVLDDEDMTPVTADAVVTNRRGVLIGVQVADCIPVLMYDEPAGIIAAVHAGWRGTASQIVSKTVRKMSGMGADPSRMAIAIGPGIRACCYEVGADVADAVSSVTPAADILRQKDGREFLDLAAANRAQAMASGVPEESIWVSGECTFCNHERFYSYRYSGQRAGRQGGFIVMW